MDEPARVPCIEAFGRCRTGDRRSLSSLKVSSASGWPWCSKGTAEGTVTVARLLFAIAARVDGRAEAT